MAVVGGIALCSKGETVVGRWRERTRERPRRGCPQGHVAKIQHDAENDNGQDPISQLYRLVIHHHRITPSSLQHSSTLINAVPQYIVASVEIHYSFSIHPAPSGTRRILRQHPEVFRDRLSISEKFGEGAGSTAHRDVNAELIDLGDTGIRFRKLPSKVVYLESV